MQEIEAKVRLEPGEIATIRQRLEAAGARRGSPEEEEENVLYDFPDGRIRAAGEVLRIRSFAGREEGRLTYKGPRDRSARYKAREELEVAVGDAQTAHAILTALGFIPAARYAKRRERWRLLGSEVTLDRLAFGEYVEVEGSEESIDRVLACLGLERRPLVREGYATLEARSRQRPP